VRNFIAAVLLALPIHVGADIQKPNNPYCPAVASVNCILSHAVDSIVLIGEEDVRLGLLSEVMYISSIHSSQSVRSSVIGVVGPTNAHLMRSINQAVIDGRQNTFHESYSEQPGIVAGYYWAEMGRGYLAKQNSAAVLMAMENALNASEVIGRRLILDVIESTLLTYDPGLTELALKAFQESGNGMSDEQVLLQMLDLAVAYMRGADVRSAEALIAQTDWGNTPPATQQDFLNFLLAMKHAAFGDYAIALNTVNQIHSSRLSFEAYSELASLWLADDSNNVYGLEALNEALVELALLEPSIDIPTKANSLIFLARKLPKKH